MSEFNDSKEPQRSHWGWGWADRFGDRAARRMLAVQIKALLGFELSEPVDPIPMHEVALKPPALEPPKDLANICDPSAEARIRHTYGRSYPDILRAFGGDFAAAPDLVAYPENEQQIIDLLRFAGNEGAKVVPWGGGTSVVGGLEIPAAADRPPVLVIDLARLNRVLKVDRLSNTALIQAGALGPDLERQLAEYDLCLRHYPQSFEFSTLGGWIATRAGGHFATLYTHIDDLVASSRMVTPTGVFESRRLPGSGAGPSPDRLVLGSEGSLGIITQAWMRVRPKPRYRAKANVLFTDFTKAVDAVRRLSQANLYPSNCRLLDKREAMLHGVDGSGNNVLLLGFESDDHPLTAWMERSLEITESLGGTCPKGPIYLDKNKAGKGRDELWKQAFFDAPYLQSTLVSLGLIADTFETACPWDRFEELHAAIVQRVRAAMKEHCGGGFLSLRFTHVYPDGPAPYYTFVAPAKGGAQAQQWSAIKQVASNTLLEFGATITHHHAVGRVHGPWYRRQAPDVFLRVLAAAKQELDPKGLLNPGVLVDPPTPKT